MSVLDAHTDPAAANAPQPEVLCADPRIRLFRNCLSADETTHLMHCARAHLHTAGVSLRDGVGVSAGRTARNAWMPHDHDAVVAAICTRLSGIAGHPLAHAEALQVVCYAPGGEYRAHFDAYDMTTARGERYTRRGGQRLCTALVYLNDVYDGGFTLFPRPDLRIVPRRGSALVFDSCRPNSRAVHPGALHASSPLGSGEKWIANLWFRERDYR